MRADRSGWIIVNPVAGQDGAALGVAAAELASAGLRSATVCRTDAPGHAASLAEAAAADGADVVVAVGGDGTVREVAEGLVRSQARSALAVVPAGTGNSFYREVWGSTPWPESLSAALGGPCRTRRVDMGQIAETGALFLLGACSGLVADALVTAAGLPGLEGRERYREAVARTIPGYPPYPGRVLVDGVVVHEGDAVLANIGGGRYRGGQFLVLPHSVLDDGLLDVCVVGGEIDAGELPGLTRTGDHTARPEVVYARGARITVERTDGLPLSFEYDGEFQRGGHSRYTATVVPGALGVLAPLSAGPDVQHPPMHQERLTR